MFWKTSLSEPSYSQGEFVQKKYRKIFAAHEVVESHLGPRRVNKQKQMDIFPQFHVTSMDIFSPLEINFVCAATRAVYLDLTEDYGTRRFISIR